MADKNIALKLSANVSQYMAAMAKAAAATKGLSSAGGDLTKLGGAMQSLGRTATIGVTVPLLALGAGAVAMAAKFDTAFAQMVGLANVPASEIDGLKESVLALAGETAVAPQELAEGLYFAASAGLEAGAAMEVVESAAMASAAGMGTTADIVGLVTSAVNAYGESNITAAQATDILTAAVNEGKAEPAEMAQTLGRVLPIAAQMGITFAEVAGATAFLTNIMGGADISTTALRDAFAKLSAPGTAAKAMLVEMGTSFAELKAAIAEDGLLGALELLRDHGFAGNLEALRALVPDMQGYTAMSALLADESNSLNGILDATANSLGQTGEAFDAVSGTSGFKMKQAMTDIKVAMIEVGTTLLPVAAQLAESISGLIGWFSDLNPAVQKVVVAFAGLAAAAGPAVFIAGSLVKNWVAVSAAFAGVGPATSSAARALGAVAIVATVAYAAWQILGEGHLNASGHIDTASGALVREVPAAFAAAVAAGEATTAVDGLAVAHMALSNAIAASADEELGGAFARLNVASVDWLDTLVALNGHWGYTTGQLDFFTVRAQLAEQALGLLSGEGEIFIGVLDEGGHSVEELANITGTSVPEMQSFLDALSLVSQYALENTAEIDAMALSYLNVQNDMGGAARQALLVAERIAGSRFEVGNATAVYEEFVKQLALLTPAQREAVFSTDAYQAALAGLPPELRALIEGTEAATEAVHGLDAATSRVDVFGKWINGFRTVTTEAKDLGGTLHETAEAVEELATVQASSIDTTSRYQDYLSDVAHILDEYSSGLDTALGGGRDWVRTHYDMAQGFQDFADEITDGEGEIDLLTQGIDANTDAGYDNAGAILDMADGIIAMTEANFAAGKSQEETNAEYQAARTALLDAAEAAGLNRADVEALIDTYGLVPDLVTTAIDLAGDALAQWRIDRYLEKLDEIPEVYATAIEAAMDMGDVATAERILRNLTTPREAWITVYANTWAAQNAMNSLSRVTGRQSAEGRFVPGGSNMITSVAERSGRAGDEVILPLGDPGRMAALLGMSEVGPRVAAALGNLSPATSGFAGMMPVSATAAGDTYVTNHVQVNMPPGSDGDDVVRALKKWQRRSGPLPLEVR